MNELNETLIKPTENLMKLLAMILMVTCVSLLSALVIWWLWPYVAVAVFSAPPLTFLQSLALWWLIRILSNASKSMKVK